MEKDVKALDINGDLRVERHEIKQAVKLASPDMEKDRKVYLDEIAKFKDMVKACDKITPDSSRGDGEIDFEEGQACLNENVSNLFKHNSWSFVRCQILVVIKKSKNLSEIPSNHNKHFCYFFCLQCGRHVLRKAI